MEPIAERCPGCGYILDPKTQKCLQCGYEPCQFCMDQPVQNESLPDEYQIRAEMKEAEAKGVHREPVDFFDDVVMEEVENGHFDDRLLKPTIEELTR